MDKQATLAAITQGFVRSQSLLLALGDENRQLLIIALLRFGCDGARVGALTAQTRLSRPAVSHHLKILKDADLVTLRKEGTKYYYAVNPNGNFAVIQSTTAMIQTLGLTSYQALIDLVQLKPGQKVLIQAGAGGVGTIAIQLAKYLGAYVATTASASSAPLVKKLGADLVIDYHQQSFDEVLHDYDLVFDTLGGVNLRKAFTILKPGGNIVSVSGLPNGQFGRRRHYSWWKTWLFSLATLNLTRWAHKYHVTYQFLFMQANGRELAELTALVEQGKLQPQIDRVFPLAQTQAALDYVAQGRAHGKVVVTVAAE